jgi:hypothetical protein
MGDNVKSDGKWAKKGQLETGPVSHTHKGGDAGAEATEKSHDVEFAKGGDTHMFGEQEAGPQGDGGTAHDTASGGKGAEFASGGKGKMFGFAGSQSARAGITSAR